MSTPSTSSSRKGAKTAIATAAATLPIERFAHAAGDDTIKIALVGCGGRGSGAASQAMNTGNVKLVAMADVDESQLAKSLSVLRRQQPDLDHIIVFRKVAFFGGDGERLAQLV